MANFDFKIAGFWLSKKVRGSWGPKVLRHWHSQTIVSCVPIELSFCICGPSCMQILSKRSYTLFVTCQYASERIVLNPRHVIYAIRWRPNNSRSAKETASHERDIVIGPAFRCESHHLIFIREEIFRREKYVF